MGGIYTLRGTTNTLGTSLGPRGNLTRCIGRDRRERRGRRDSKAEGSRFGGPDTSAFGLNPFSLIRCEEAVDESVLCELRRRVKIEEHHDLRFMKLDSLR